MLTLYIKLKKKLVQGPKDHILKILSMVNKEVDFIIASVSQLYFFMI